MNSQFESIKKEWQAMLYCESLDQALELIYAEVTEGFLIPNNLLSLG